MAQLRKLTPAEMLSLANKALERHPPASGEERRIDTPMRSALPLLRRDKPAAPTEAESREYLRLLLDDAYFCELDRRQQMASLLSDIDEESTAILKYSSRIGAEHSERLLSAYHQLWPNAQPHRRDQRHLLGIMDDKWQQAFFERQPSQRYAIVLFLQVALHYELALAATIGTIARDLAEKAVARLMRQSVHDLSALVEQASLEDADDPEDEPTSRK